MKIKSFRAHLEKRLNKAEIAEIEAAALLEFEALRLLQKDISSTVLNYMSENDIGFNEFARRLGKSPSQISKIIKGKANLTIATIAQLFALMGHRPHLVAAV